MPTDHLRKEHPGDKSFKDSMTWQKWGFLKMGTPTFIQFIGHFFGGETNGFAIWWWLSCANSPCPMPYFRRASVAAAYCGAQKAIRRRFLVCLKKGYPESQKFLKSNGSIMILPSLSDRFDNGIPHFGLHKKAVDMLTSSHSHSLSLSPLGKLPWVSL